jgi:tRNA(Ile)-lysidine synthase
MPSARRPSAFSAKSLLGVLQSDRSARPYIVGFSGGADSTALLHALNVIKDQLGVPISAVHVNHGLHADSDTWQKHCEAFCHQNRIKLTCLKIELNHQSGKGLEAEARHLRYRAISGLLMEGATLLTAHHADDQAETLLLNLMRGSGVDGLAAMPEFRPLGKGQLQRPLLEFQNDELTDYLRENNIEWIDDPSNQYLNHDRNFVRHEIIPLLERRWPGLNKRLLLTRRAMADARFLLERLADEYLGEHLCHPYVLQIKPQIFDDQRLFKLVIRRWVKQSGASSIPAVKLDSFSAQFVKANSKNNIELAWDGWSLRLYQQKLWLLEGIEISPCPLVAWPQRGSEVFLGRDVGQLSLISTIDHKSVMTSPDGNFVVAGRTGMTTKVINHQGHHKTLKNLFQSANIPSWLRDCIPLCQLDGELVAMGDWCFNDSFKSWMTQHGIEMSWRPAHPLLQFILTRQHSRHG